MAVPKKRKKPAPTPSPAIRSFSAIVEGDIRDAQYQGRDYIVLPMVAVVEGILDCSNCGGPSLALASEFAKVTGAWNGRPLTLPHPSKDGQLASAGDPAILEQFGIGWVFNATLEDKSLKVEAWVD